MLLKNCNLKGKLVDIYINSGKIDRIIPAGSSKLREDSSVDIGGKTVIPGMIDVHTHGCCGDDTMEAEFKKLQDEWGKHGTTTVYPTTMTMDFDSIKIEDIYINPKTHELFILDGWENVSATSKRNYLKDIRQIAKDVMDCSTANDMCMRFLNGKPASTAYDDFANWDEVIMKGFGGHNFHQFNQ